MTGSRLFVIAIVLGLAGAGLLAAGLYDRALARAQQDFAAQRFDAADASLETLERYLDYGQWIPSVGRALDDVRTRRTAIRYWSRDYDQVVADQQAADEASTPTDLQLIAANAAFRRGQALSTDKQRTLDALQTATSAYLAVLRNASPEPSPATIAAAHNYEYVVRTRDDVEKGRRAPELTDTAEDGPAGKKGGRPPEPPKRDQMKMLVPLEPGEMDQGIEPGRGGRIDRKG